MRRTFIHNATLVNEGRQTIGSIVVAGGRIAEVLEGEALPASPCDETINADGCYLLPGVIDDHVHFRDPGLTHKADIFTESRAAAAGGVTSIMDMPNTNPQTTTIAALEEKLDLLDRKCIVNHSCYFGATNDNYKEFARIDRHRVCGIKLFMGSSTGNMLVDRLESLRHVFYETDMLIAAHCESQDIIRQNTERCKARYGEKAVPMKEHSRIRSREACYASSELAVGLAREAGARLHLLHLSTKEELNLLTTGSVADKRVTAEACVAHLLFTVNDYKILGSRIKCNPAVKELADREALRRAVNEDLIDVIATDHAPHLLMEKGGDALHAASGMPMVQFSLPAMLELTDQGVFSIETVVRKMCHAPADLFHIQGRGYLRQGYRADLVLVRPHTPWEVTPCVIQSKCEWSPLEGTTFHWKVEKTFVNGHLVYDGTHVDGGYRGEALRFE
ncbi:MAG: dihydroorotase [Prevotellaceae bacterium]|nr:dihydroorotase [Prevotellaceae bacterium]